jgi:hypothetical protein
MNETENELSIEAACAYFIGLVIEHPGHARCAIPWISPLLLGVGRITNTIKLLPSPCGGRSRRPYFEHCFRRFALTYSHPRKHPRQHQCIKVRELLRNGRYGKIITEVTNLAEAENVQQTLRERLNTFIGEQLETAKP